MITIVKKNFRKFQKGLGFSPSTVTVCSVLKYTEAQCNTVISVYNSAMQCNIMQCNGAALLFPRSNYHCPVDHHTLCTHCTLHHMWVPCK